LTPSIILTVLLPLGDLGLCLEEGGWYQNRS